MNSCFLWDRCRIHSMVLFTYSVVDLFYVAKLYQSHGSDVCFCLSDIWWMLPKDFDLFLESKGWKSP